MDETYQRLLVATTFVSSTNCDDCDARYFHLDALLEHR
jgi:hypothetical protein